ncbi:MAG: DUF5343 domain-containing protein [Chloroflexi bacterium]|nr:DUF5343 domain-containing protein [Chloroflexota bacterium]
MTLANGNDKGRRRLPPYISYRTFRNFLDELQQGIPARIDRSYWGERLSGSSGTQLMAALRFLALIDASNVPTPRLRNLVYAKGSQRMDFLKQMIVEAFSFLGGTVDPQTATYAQLEEAFHHTFQLTSDVSRKCIKFYVAIAVDAGFTLSPFITKRLRSARSGTGTKIITRKKNARTIQTAPVAQEVELFPGSMSWDKLLLTKFPSFDPTWKEDIQLNWFKAYGELLKMRPGHNGE